MTVAVSRDIDPRFARPRTLFFGVGAQKAATSWLDHYLRDHPEVCLPVRKEQHYWDTHRLPAGGGKRLEKVGRELARIERRGLWKRLTRTPRRRALDEAWRRNDAMLRDRAPGHRAYADALFQVWRNEAVVGEITPAYALLGPETYAEMAALGSDVRFLFVMRDPVGRLLSGVRMNQRKDAGREGEPPGRLAERFEAALCDPQHPSMLRSRYDLTLTRLDAAVPRERICCFFYESLFRQEEMDRLTDFLGIARRPARVSKRVNAGRPSAERLDPALEARALAVLEPVYDFIRARFGARVPETWRQPPRATAALARSA
jgi:hypothetical protein